MYDSKLPIILIYDVGAGGKFIWNCLSLSRHTVQCTNHCVPLVPLPVEYLLNFPDDYDFREKVIYSSLPKDSKHMHLWRKQIELHERPLYDANIYEQWAMGIRTRIVNENTKRLLKSNLRFPMFEHGSDLRLLETWPNSTVIRLVHADKFIEIACIKKSMQDDAKFTRSKERYQILAGASWPSWEEFNAANLNTELLVNEYSQDVKNEIQQHYAWYKHKTIDFNIDACIFDEQPFAQAMHDLYLTLGFDDFNETRVISFWKEYIKIHKT